MQRKIQGIGKYKSYRMQEFYLLTFIIKIPILLEVWELEIRVVDLDLEVYLIMYLKKQLMN